MNRVDVITLFPEMIEQFSRYGVVGRAMRTDQFKVRCWNPRDFARDRHRTVDDRPYGGGPGMVMMYQPLHDAIEAARADSPDPGHVIYLTPQGRPLDQVLVRRLLDREKRLILLAGRYEGIDERLIANDVDEEVSIGDYVLSGGELPALVMIDVMARWLPGTLGHELSAIGDSFADGMLEAGQFTRPEQVDGHSVPGVLLSGDHERIARWRLKQSLGRTWQKRPDLLESQELSPEYRALLDEFILEFDGSGKK